MQRAREALLADPGLTGQQHRDLRAGGLAQKCDGFFEGFRTADQLTQIITRAERAAQAFNIGLQILQPHQQGIGLVVLLHLGAVGPLLDRPALDPAVLMPAGRALNFLVQNLLAEEASGVTRRIAEQHPAHRAVAAAEVARVRLDLPGMIPAEDAVIGAGLKVEFTLLGRDLHRALEHM